MAEAPSDFVLVPRVPTQEMCQQGQWKAQEWPRFPLRISPIYQAMLAAAPAAPVDPATDGLPPGCRRISMSEMFKDLPVRDAASPASTAGGPVAVFFNGNEGLLNVAPVWLKSDDERGPGPFTPHYLYAAPSVAPVELVEAAKAVLAAVDQNIDSKTPPGKYTVPWAEMTALRLALAGVKEASHEA